ncbi:hypothetical protein CBR_g34289 [Chara braunii]|uniref:Uncharacterized protein n=1 Tax=Chara braunii TaxID=69332 RepID=A0A388JYR9_CHABU|nr:hypothetical protein CBR_g34289 [Chara braunii]|eukprot:GBG62917.1 hypothetical protein CBR_g34289 [Chara braunii]
MGRLKRVGNEKCRRGRRGGAGRAGCACVAGSDGNGGQAVIHSFISFRKGGMEGELSEWRASRHSFIHSERGAFIQKGGHGRGAIGGSAVAGGAVEAITCFKFNRIKHRSCLDSVQAEGGRVLKQTEGSEEVPAKTLVGRKPRKVVVEQTEGGCSGSSGLKKSPPRF